jgi:hypothetical protein
MKEFFKPKINETYQTYRREPLYRDQPSPITNEDVIYASTGDNRMMNSVHSLGNIGSTTSYSLDQKIAAF